MSNPISKLPEVKSFTDWAEPLEDTLRSLSHQLDNFSVPSQGRCHIVTGDTAKMSNDLKKVLAFLTRVKSDIVKDSVCCIQFAPKSEGNEGVKRRKKSAPVRRAEKVDTK